MSQPFTRGFGRPYGVGPAGQVTTTDLRTLPAQAFGTLLRAPAPAFTLPPPNTMRDPGIITPTPAGSRTRRGR